MATETATVVHLNESSRRLFKLMHFEDIPEEANYIAFSDDGMAQFLEELVWEPGTIPPFPEMAMFSFRPEVQLLVSD